MSKEAAVLDLPPAPPAYVEVCPDLSDPQSKEIIAALKGGDHDPPQPPHDHEHAEDGPRAYRLRAEPGQIRVTGQDVGLKHSSVA